MQGARVSSENREYMQTTSMESNPHLCKHKVSCRVFIGRRIPIRPLRTKTSDERKVSFVSGSELQDDVSSNAASFLTVQWWADKKREQQEENVTFVRHTIIIIDNQFPSDSDMVEVDVLLLMLLNPTTATCPTRQTDTHRGTIVSSVQDDSVHGNKM